MILTDDIKQAIDSCVLCWLATVNSKQVPNVSPKEVFTYQGDDTVLIANIASPKSVLNIATNANVCVSFIDIFKQKGFKLVGKANIIEKSDNAFDKQYQPLYAMAGDAYPIHNIINITVEHVAPIIAPSYKLFPDKTEAQQVENAMASYGVKPI